MLQVLRDDKTRTMLVQLHEVPWRCALSRQLAVIAERLAAEQASAPPATAARKAADSIEKQKQRRRALASMSFALFPFSSLVTESATRSRRTQVPASVPSFRRATLSKAAELGPARREAWRSAGVREDTYDLLHPGGRPIAIKMCARCPPSLLPCR